VTLWHVLRALRWQKIVIKISVIICVYCNNTIRNAHFLFVKSNHHCLMMLQRPYQCPLISTLCWHVHCQHCWTKSLVCILHTHRNLLSVSPSCAICMSPYKQYYHPNVSAAVNSLSVCQSKRESVCHCVNELNGLGCNLPLSYQTGC